MVLSAMSYGLYRGLRLGRHCKTHGRLGNVDRRKVRVEIIILSKREDILIIIFNMRRYGGCLSPVHMMLVMFLPRIVALTYGCLP